MAEGSTPSTPRAQKALLRNDVYEAVLSAILDQQLEPGELLREEELVTWLGVSRAPIRDALKRLQQENLIDVLPNRSTRVAPIDTQESLGMLILHSDLFALGIRLATPRLGADDIDELTPLLEEVQEAARRGTMAALGNPVGEFLRFFTDRSGNSRLAAYSRAYSPHLRRSFSLQAGIQTVPEIVNGLEEILERVKAGDGSAAADRLRQLAQPAVDYFRKLVYETPTES